MAEVRFLCRDLLEIVAGRYDARSIIVTSQVPIDRRHEIIGDPTIADAILDRLVHNLYRIELRGESMLLPRRLMRAICLSTLAYRPAVRARARDCVIDLNPRK